MDIFREESAESTNGDLSKHDLPDREEKDFTTVSLFGSKNVNFTFDRALLAPVAESSQITNIYKNILPLEQNSSVPYYPTVDELFNNLKESKTTESQAQILFCGGPISAIRTCPRGTEQGIFNLMLKNLV